MQPLQYLAQSAPPAEGGVSGVVVWVGLAVLFVVFFLLIRRLAPGSKPTERIEEDSKAPAALPAAEPDDEAPQLSLKEIRAAKAAKLDTAELDREAIRKAREARKGKTSVLLGQPGEDDKARTGEAEAVAPTPVEEPVPAEVSEPSGAQEAAPSEAPSPALVEAATTAPLTDEALPDDAAASLGDDLFPALDMRPKASTASSPSVSTLTGAATAPAAAEPAATPAPPEKPAPVAVPAPVATPTPAPPEPVAEDHDDEDDEEDEDDDEDVAPPAAAVPAAAPARPAKAEPERPKPKSLADGLEKTRTGFVGRLKGLFSKKRPLDDDLIEELEEVLFTADIGVKTSERLLEAVQRRLGEDSDVSAEKALQVLRDETARILLANQRALEVGSERPYVVLIIGVNGVGKTTTIGKLASKFRSQGHDVHLIAGDTFRAAAIQQLQVWGERTGCKVHAGGEKADPSAVVFDGLKQAQADGADVVLVDTAGRLHTKVNLVEELKKVNRVCDKALPGAPHHSLLVLDANTGQNAINQAEMFNKEVGITGIVLTKLDGTAKGGVIIGISDQLSVPVQFIGIGEQVEDLRPFRAQEFVEALF
jgi:fused signal recognition particle receptor